MYCEIQILEIINHFKDSVNHLQNLSESVQRISQLSTTQSQNHLPVTFDLTKLSQ